MDFSSFLFVVCGFMVLVAAIGMCAKCRGGRSGEADFGSTPAAVSTKGAENTIVVVDTE
ncbi:hypothetical protein GHT06_016309 [Daphnia sinensis]|uniref:Uncharacterized protein n=1 Tax=Daphnia sinensis TaxID=1820382 RepID=A0AAD5L717_9CRUS|nr:hypothetical protein GHT06_016309 [Daphnia sinensis]